jgi:6-phosphofructokinase 1
MPRDFITDDGFGITDKARAYLQPLIGGEDYPTYQTGLPVYTKILGALAPKRTGRDFDVN